VSHDEARQLISRNTLIFMGAVDRGLVG